MPEESWPTRPGQKKGIEYVAPAPLAAMPPPMPTAASPELNAFIQHQSAKQGANPLSPAAIQQAAQDAQRRLAEAMAQKIAHEAGQPTGKNTGKNDGKDNKDAPKKDTGKSGKNKAVVDPMDSPHEQGTSMMRRCKMGAETCMSLIFMLPGVHGADSLVTTLKAVPS